MEVDPEELATIAIWMADTTITATIAGNSPLIYAFFENYIFQSNGFFRMLPHFFRNARNGFNKLYPSVDMFTIFTLLNQGKS